MRDDDGEEERTTPPEKKTSTDTEDKNDLRLALLELRSRFSASGVTSFEPMASHGFTEAVKWRTLSKKQLAFSLLILYRRPFQFIISTQHVMDVLEVFQELFKDIPNFEQQMEVLPLLNREVTQAEHYLQAMVVTEIVEHISDEMYSLLPEFDLQF